MEVVMKTFFPIFLFFLILIPAFTVAQEKKPNDRPAEYRLKSDKLTTQAKELDNQILILNKKISDLIKDYSLASVDDIKTVPYQTTYKRESGYIEIERHVFIRDKIHNQMISGIRKKKIRIYINGQTVSKIESTVYQEIFNTEEKNIVYIVDPSPVTPGIDDIQFTHTIDNKVIINKKKLGEIKNTSAFPVRNDIKRTFLIPHLKLFYDYLMTIAESYYKSKKDFDNNMGEFLKKAAKY